MYEGASETWPSCQHLCSPECMLADRMEWYAEELNAWLGCQPGDVERERCLDLMMGLLLGADSLRVLRSDLPNATATMETAIRYLERVDDVDLAPPPMP